MKQLTAILKKGLPVIVLFLLFFIPLYPKLPLVDIQNTWVYVRVEDFVVLVTLLIWFYLLIKKEVTLKTPLTIPILAFWVIGAIATIHGVVIIFPTIAHVFPNVALLAYIRHIEYLSVFFIAYSAARNKKFALAAIWSVVGTLLLVVAYGIGQKYLSFPAYLTMNEEYAKGIPIIISPLNRVSATFAGHYDLAAYLVLVIPIVVSLIFGFKNMLIKIFLILTSLLGLFLLFLTVSRVSFFVLFIGLFFVVLFQKKKLLLFMIPFVVVGFVLFSASQSSLLARFGNTVKEVDVIVDAQTGGAIGHVTMQPRDYLYDKAFLVERDEQDDLITSVSLFERNKALREGVPPRLIPYRLPKQVGVVPATITSTGETLPQGSSYINLSLSPVTKKLGVFFYEYPPTDASPTASVKPVLGDFLVKRVAAYDLSFTTRFQGEWPNALRAFGRNLFFGSGYGSVSLAVDNNYYRMLGETGLLGTLSFIAIFVVLGIYLRKSLPLVENKAIKAFAVGLAAGIIGLSFNAILIDVFEASKIAFILWLLVGILVGTLSIYSTKNFHVYRELWKAATSMYAIVIYLLLLIVVIFSATLTWYFIGDDFTWFRWAADCKFNAPDCNSYFSVISRYFYDSAGFFYRPGTKAYFFLMYPLFWLNQVIYHVVSIGLHFIVVALLYLLARKIFRNNLMAAAASFIFVFASGYLEIVVWIAATGHLFNAVFILTSLLLFIKWNETRNSFYLVISLLSAFIALLFHELGIITPFLMLAYRVAMSEKYHYKDILSNLKNRVVLLLFIPNVIYFIVRYFAHTHWFSGDYSYNVLKFPLNAIGNTFGYVLISAFGPLSFPLYEKMRELTRTNIPLAFIGGIVLIAIIFFVGRHFLKTLTGNERRIVMFSTLFVIITLIPFLGLGNITSRYSYLASFGVIMILVVLVSKLYKYLLSYGKDIAVTSIAVLVSVFCLLHIIQAQQTIIDWGGAGNKVESFLNSLDSLYDESWSREHVDLRFSKVPIKNNDAWIFPVGLEDAIWFAFKNDNIRVHTYEQTEHIPQSSFLMRNSYSFEFQPDGSLKRLDNPLLKK